MKFGLLPLFILVLGFTSLTAQAEICKDAYVTSHKQVGFWEGIAGSVGMSGFQEISCTDKMKAIASRFNDELSKPNVLPRQIKEGVQDTINFLLEIKSAHPGSEFCVAAVQILPYAATLKRDEEYIRIANSAGCNNITMAALMSKNPKTLEYLKLTREEPTLRYIVAEASENLAIGALPALKAAGFNLNIKYSRPGYLRPDLLQSCYPTPNWTILTDAVHLRKYALAKKIQELGGSYPAEGPTPYFVAFAAGDQVYLSQLSESEKTNVDSGYCFAPTVRFAASNKNFELLKYLSKEDLKGGALSMFLTQAVVPLIKAREQKALFDFILTLQSQIPAGYKGSLWSGIQLVDSGITDTEFALFAKALEATGTSFNPGIRVLFNEYAIYWLFPRYGSKVSTGIAKLFAEYRKRDLKFKLSDYFFQQAIVHASARPVTRELELVKAIQNAKAGYQLQNIIAKATGSTVKITPRGNPATRPAASSLIKPILNGVTIALESSLLKDGDLKLISQFRKGYASRQAQVMGAKALAAKHLLKYPDQSLSIDQAFAGLKSSVGIAASHVRLKEKLEVYLEKQLLKKPLVYNRDAVNIFNVLQEGKLQCSSGTALFQIALLQSAYKATAHSVPVAIYTSGHVLPGVLKSNGKEWSLEGIEMTVAGQAQIKFGKVKDITVPMAVVELSDYLVSETLSQAMVDAAGFKAAIQAKMQKHYGFKPQVGYSGGGAQNNEALNSSVFGFGSANVPPGDLSRGEKSNLESGSYSGSGVVSNLLVRVDETEKLKTDTKQISFEAGPKFIDHKSLYYSIFYLTESQEKADRTGDLIENNFKIGYFEGGMQLKAALKEDVSWQSSQQPGFIPVRYKVVPDKGILQIAEGRLKPTTEGVIDCVYSSGSYDGNLRLSAYRFLEDLNEKTTDTFIVGAGMSSGRIAFVCKVPSSSDDRTAIEAVEFLMENIADDSVEKVKWNYSGVGR